MAEVTETEIVLPHAVIPLRGITSVRAFSRQRNDLKWLIVLAGFCVGGFGLLLGLPFLIGGIFAASNGEYFPLVGGILGCIAGAWILLWSIKSRKISRDDLIVEISSGFDRTEIQFATDQVAQQFMSRIRTAMAHAGQPVQNIDARQVHIHSERGISYQREDR